MVYKEYIIDNDMWLKQRKHIYHLMGKDSNTLVCVASYSLKTKRLIIKDAPSSLPPEHILREFIQYCENKEVKEDG